jgi:hypothetical protein
MKSENLKRLSENRKWWRKSKKKPSASENRENTTYICSEVSRTAFLYKTEEA